MLRYLCTLVALAALAVGLAQAPLATVQLNDGSSLDGAVTVSSQVVAVTADGRTRFLERAQVARVDFLGASTLPAAPLAGELDQLLLADGSVLSGRVTMTTAGISLSSDEGRRSFATGEVTAVLLSPQLPVLVRPQRQRRAVLYVADASSNAIFQVDPNSGTVLSSFPAPFTLSDVGACGLAATRQALYLTDAFNTSDVYVLDPASGTVLTSFPKAFDAIDALGFGLNEIIALDYDGDVVSTLDPVSGVETNALFLSDDLIGGADFGSDRLFVTGGDNQLFELDPATGGVLQSFSLPGDGFYTGVAVSGQRLFVGDQTNSTIVELDASTGAVLNTFPAPGSTLCGLAGVS
ncbi:MAG: PQQ-binding-like beta-propeller repeat protein [Deinococcus sp.]|nr:PQQ-binding-like beta-propeller repeat protein [Deinococcus sp.]